MTPIPTENAAVELSKLHASKFYGRRSGGFQVQKEKFREFLGRHRVETGVVAEIAEHLLKNHKIHLIECSEFFAFLSEDELAQLRAMPYEPHRWATRKT